MDECLCLKRNAEDVRKKKKKKRKTIFDISRGRKTVCYDWLVMRKSAGGCL
jgi:hypothetical protein